MFPLRFKFATILLLASLWTASLLASRQWLQPATAATAGSSGQRPFILGDKSFTIRSLIRIAGSKTAHLTERYSREQRRAKIQYNGELNDPKMEEFLYDAGRGLLVINYGQSWPDHCGRCELASFYQYLFPQLHSEIHSLLQLADESADVSHIVGPAKLLFVIAGHLDKMTGPMKAADSDGSGGGGSGSGSNGTTTTGQRVPKYGRNMQVVEFRLELPMAKLSILYESNARVRSGEAVPLRVKINFTGASVSIYIDFFGLHSESPRAPSASSSGGGGGGQQQQHAQQQKAAGFDLAATMGAAKVIDEFAFPLANNCTRAFGKEHLGDLFALASTTETRFSFTAHSRQSMRAGQEEHYVAYDGMSRLLRIDHRRRGGFLLGQRGSADDDFTLNILDFRTNRRYIMAAEDKTAAAASRKLCAVTYAVTPEAKRHAGGSGFQFADFLLGSDQFAYMGRAQVRGIPAVVYEAFTSKLPGWFSQRLVYKDGPNGTYRVRERNEPAREKLSKASRLRQQKGANQFNVLAYVAEYRSDAPVGVLLRLEVYDLRLESRSAFRLAVEADFHHFAWDLSEAPNGDRARELFEHQQLCSVAAAGFAEVDLLLEEDIGGRSAGKKTPQWVEDPLQRQDALRTGISETLHLPNIMIYDLESTCHRQPVAPATAAASKDGHYSISASFRVAEHPHYITGLTFVGNADLEMAAASIVATQSGASLAECLWLAGGNSDDDGAQQSIYVYYSEVSQSCVADSKLEESKLFRLDAEGHGEVYKIEPRKDLEIGFANSWLFGAEPKKFQNRMMVLQRLEAGDLRQQVDPSDLWTRIRQIKVKNFNYINGALGGEQEPTDIYRPAPVSFLGFGLPDSSPYSRRVQLGTRADASGGGSDDGTDDQDDVSTVPSLQQCQTACLADLECQSFSYCVRLPQVHCVLSNASFQSAEVRRQLQAGAALQAGRSGKAVRVKDGPIELELVRDFRCELHNKIYLGLFKPAVQTIVRLKGYQIVEVGEGGETQCARLCFERSLDSMRSGVAIGAQIRVALERRETGPAESISKELEELREMRARVVAKFCQRFFYLDSKSAADDVEQLFKQLAARTSQQTPESTIASRGGGGGSNNGVAVAGFCALEEEESSKQVEQASQSAAQLQEMEMRLFRMREFEFDFSNLYEKSSGFNLVSSRLSREESDAYWAVRNWVGQHNISETQLELVKRAVREGKNFQQRIDYANEMICAHQCYSQRSGLWPACQSFDMVVTHHEHIQTVTLHCSLNSMSLDQLKQQVGGGGGAGGSTSAAIVKLPATKLEQLWHYEPRPGLVRQTAEYAADVEQVITEQQQQKQRYGLNLGPPTNGDTAHLAAKSLVRLLLVTIGAATGVVLGLHLAHRMSAGAGFFHSRRPFGGHSVEETSANSFVLSSPPKLDLDYARLNDD